MRLAIITRNRFAYLDATLRSLSATNLPPDLAVTVWDDCSDDGDTIRYFSTNELIPVVWPPSVVNDKRFGELRLRQSVCFSQSVGIKGKVEVAGFTTTQQVGDATEVVRHPPMGVVEFSRSVVYREFGCCDDRWMLLMQDDIVLNPDWYERIVDHATAVEHRDDIAMISGINIACQADANCSTPVVGFVSAQCLMISRDFFERSNFWKHTSDKTSNFDLLVCRAAKRAKMKIHRLRPGVGQHIGFESIVRPKVKWWGKHDGMPGYRYVKDGRVDPHSQFPYAYTRDVRSFPHPKVEA